MKITIDAIGDKDTEKVVELIKTHFNVDAQKTTPEYIKDQSTIPEDERFYFVTFEVSDNTTEETFVNFYKEDPVCKFDSDDF